MVSDDDPQPSASTGSRSARRTSTTCSFTRMASGTRSRKRSASSTSVRAATRSPRTRLERARAILACRFAQGATRSKPTRRRRVRRRSLSASASRPAWASTRLLTAVTRNRLGTASRPPSARTSRPWRARLVALGQSSRSTCSTARCARHSAWMLGACTEASATPSSSTASASWSLPEHELPRAEEQAAQRVPVAEGAACAEPSRRRRPCRRRASPAPWPAGGPTTTSGASRRSRSAASGHVGARPRPSPASGGPPLHRRPGGGRRRRRPRARRWQESRSSSNSAIHRVMVAWRPVVGVAAEVGQDERLDQRRVARLGGVADGGVGVAVRPEPLARPPMDHAEDRAHHAGRARPASSRSARGGGGTTRGADQVGSRAGCDVRGRPAARPSPAGPARRRTTGRRGARGTRRPAGTTWCRRPGRPAARRGRSRSRTCSRRHRHPQDRRLRPRCRSSM